MHYLRELRLAVFFLLGGAVLNPVSANSFSFSFDWGDIPKCTSGNPGRVTNPTFKFKNVPDGTVRMDFKMKDLDVTSFNHGGGKVKKFSGTTVKPGAFKYASPCPPNGSHTYQWTATAKDKKGKKLGVAKATKKYP